MSELGPAVIIPREAVGAGDTEPILLALSVFVRSKTLAPQVIGKVRIQFSGFKSDGRELWQVPEVRVFVERLDTVFPYWFFLADLRYDSLLVLTFCLCRVIDVSRTLSSVDGGDLSGFMERQFQGMNQLFEEFGLSGSLNKERSDDILDYFARRGILN